MLECDNDEGVRGRVVRVGGIVKAWLKLVRGRAVMGMSEIRAMASGRGLFNREM